MKPFVGLFLFSALSSIAGIVDFNVSPPGTDRATGMSPLNEVPAVTNSAGSGGEISPGIFLDTESGRLGFAIGYGSSAGFTDLTGVPTAMHFHAPAGAGTNASVIINLGPFDVPAANPATGGRILGAVGLTPQQMNQFLSGLVYVNIHTALNPGGEIRGQLIPAITNQPPTVFCPASSVVECAVPTTLTGSVSDPEGDAMTAVWSVNGAAVLTNSVAAGATNLTDVTITASFPLGTNTILLSVTDAAGNTATCSSTLRVVDTTPPVIVSITPSKTSLWPPNHKLIPINISAVVTDACSTVTWKISSVTSSQSQDGLGDGHTAVDWQIVDKDTVKLRAERSGKDGERTYTVTIQATDLSGNQATAGVQIKVPHDQSGKPKKKKGK